MTEDERKWAYPRKPQAQVEADVALFKFCKKQVSNQNKLCSATKAIAEIAWAIIDLLKEPDLPICTTPCLYNQAKKDKDRRYLKTRELLRQKFEETYLRIDEIFEQTKQNNLAWESIEALLTDLYGVTDDF